MTKVITYLRCATDEQDSILQKRKDLEKLINEHASEWDLVGSYEDIGVSGNAKERKGMSRLLNEIDKKDAKLLITLSPSMISRDISLFQQIQEILNSNGVQLIFA